MLTLETIFKIWKKDIGRPEVALDRHDNRDHRTSYSSSVPFQYQPSKGSIKVNIGYDSNGNLVQK